MSKAMREYRFVIDVTTPDDLPMARLAKYMAGLAKVLGSTESVHFTRLESGSTVLVQGVEAEAEPNVMEQLREVAQRHAPDEVMKAYYSLDKQLRADRATAWIEAPEGEELVRFPGGSQPEHETWGSLLQSSRLNGVVIRVGGKGDPVPVHLQAGDQVYVCSASRSIAKGLANHLFEGVLRVQGPARWRRGPSGKWTMSRFKIEGFEVLDSRPLSQAIEKLRALDGKEWRFAENAYDLLLQMREDESND